MKYTALAIFLMASWLPSAFAIDLASVSQTDIGAGIANPSNGLVTQNRIIGTYKKNTGTLQNPVIVSVPVSINFQVSNLTHNDLKVAVERCMALASSQLSNSLLSLHIEAADAAYPNLSDKTQIDLSAQKTPLYLYCALKHL